MAVCPLVAASILVYGENGVAGVTALLKRAATSTESARRVVRADRSPDPCRAVRHVRADAADAAASSGPAIPSPARARDVPRVLRPRPGRRAGLDGIRDRPDAGSVERASGRHPHGAGVGRLAPRASPAGAPGTGVDRRVVSLHGGDAGSHREALQQHGEERLRHQPVSRNRQRGLGSLPERRVALRSAFQRPDARSRRGGRHGGLGTAGARGRKRSDPSRPGSTAPARRPGRTRRRRS
jgi:hypothetical protein